MGFIAGLILLHATVFKTNREGQTFWKSLRRYSVFIYSGLFNYKDTFISRELREDVVTDVMFSGFIISVTK